MMDALGLALLLTAIALSVAWLLAWPLAHVWRRALAKMPSGHALRLGRWSLLALVVPLGVGALVALGASGVLDHGFACHCVGPGTFHVCLVHPAAAAPTVPLATVFLALIALRIAPALRRLARALGSGKRLVARAARAPRDGAVALLDIADQNAFTVGGRRPVVVTSAAWWRSLTGREREMVAAHEEAHVVRRDPLNLGIARGLSALLPAATDGLVWWWQAAAEHDADRHAARVVGDPVEVAEFLLRQQCGHPPLGLAAHGTATEQRITALLDCSLPTAPPGGDLDLTLAGVVGLGLLGVAFGAELHYLAEGLLAWFA